MKIKLDETGKVISMLNAGIDNSYIDAPDLPSDHEFGVIDYAYINGSYDKVPSEINELITAPQPTLEQRVEAVEEVTAEVITILNNKGIAP